MFRLVVASTFISDVVALEMRDITSARARFQDHQRRLEEMKKGFDARTQVVQASMIAKQQQAEKDFVERSNRIDLQLNNAEKLMTEKFQRAEESMLAKEKEVRQKLEQEEQELQRILSRRTKKDAEFFLRALLKCNALGYIQLRDENFGIFHCFVILGGAPELGRPTKRERMACI